MARWSPGEYNNWSCWNFTSTASELFKMSKNSYTILLKKITW